MSAQGIGSQNGSADRRWRPAARPWSRRLCTRAAGLILLALVAATGLLVVRSGGRGTSSRSLLLERAARHDVGAADGLMRLLDSAPEDLEVVKAVVALALVADDPDASLHWLARWHAVAPDDAVPPRLALEVASRTGRFDAVRIWGERLLSGAGDPIPVLERLVPAELATGSFTEATAHARRLRQLRGDRDDVALLLARCLQASGLDDEARDILAPLVRRDPPDAAAAAAFASLSRQGRGDEAVISLLEEAIAAASDPTAVQAARHELRRALMEAGRNEEARVVSEEWERFEAARSAVVDAYHRPSSEPLRDRVVESLSATRQDARASEVLADLAAAAAQPRPASPFPGPAIGASRTDGPAVAPQADGAGVVFDDVTAAAGIDFRHDGDATPDHLIQETMGSGLAWIDYDRDGHADLFCVQVTTSRSASRGHRLYRNLGGGRFADATVEAGVDGAGPTYGMGVEVGDVDNDGFDDLVVSGIGGLSLLRNTEAADGRRRFVDVSAESGLSNPHWGTGLALVDVDGDALLDLYVANYVEIDPREPAVCRDFRTGLPQPCTPTAYPHRHHAVFRNEGGCRFSDATERFGLLEVRPAAGLGVVAADFDSDGRCDLFVANDMGAAYFLRNAGGRFRDVGLESGCSHGPEGRLMAGMGVVADDLDGSGHASLFVTNFHFEPNVLFRGDGTGGFMEASLRSGLGGPSIRTLGFGAVALDADLDGRLDLAVANGHVNRNAPRISAAPFAQPMQVFLGEGGGRFRDVTGSAGAAINRPRVGRGLAVSDFDSDGNPDLAVSENGGPVAVLRNTSALRRGWIRLALEGDGRASNPSAIGARVEIVSPAGSQIRFVCGGGSYLSASDRRLSIGLDPGTDAITAVVQWPSGNRETFGPLAAKTDWRLVEGRPPERPPH